MEKVDYSKWKVIKIHMDMVRGGYNFNLHRQNPETKEIVCHRIGRFGGELCDIEDDEALAFDVAQFCALNVAAHFSDCILRIKT